MKESNSGITKKFNNFIDGLIAIRQSGEPFFGVQTVFGPVIDKLAEQRRARQLPPDEPEEDPSGEEHTIRSIF